MVLPQPGACHALSGANRIVSGSQIDGNFIPPAPKGIETPPVRKRQTLPADHAPFDVGGDKGDPGRGI